MKDPASVQPIVDLPLWVALFGIFIILGVPFWSWLHGDSTSSKIFGALCIIITIVGTCIRDCQQRRAVGRSRGLGRDRPRIPHTDAPNTRAQQTTMR